ncbi:MAG: hypothetical protein ACLTG4_03575 [Oscillospiraceae bacterium]
MKQHPFRIRLPRRLVSSVQFRFAVTFTILVAILLALMNTYPTRASRDIVFTEKQSALTTAPPSCRPPCRCSTISRRTTRGRCSPCSTCAT